jgi:peroxiredoxin
MKLLFIFLELSFASLAFAQTKNFVTYDSIVKVAAVGMPAPDFSRKDVNGKALKLSDFKGKCVLLDYWASWCGPCRGHTPVVKALYNKYHSKGFEVIAISCDNEYEDWQNAVKQDSVEMFHHILSFTDEDMAFAKGKKGSQVYKAATFKGELRKKYNLMPIPVEILIDANGIIVGRYLGYNEAGADEDLNKKLSEIFDEK